MQEEKKVKNYIALFESGESGGFSVVFPDFPGCVSAGDNYKEAYDMAIDALVCHTDGEKIPEPRTLEQIKETWEDWGEWERDGNFLVVPIPLLLEPKAQRINITLPADLLFEVDKRTKNRSGFIAKALRAYL